MSNPYQSPLADEHRGSHSTRQVTHVGRRLVECFAVGCGSTVAGLLLAMALRMGVPEEMGAEYWMDTSELLLFLPWVMVLHNLLPTGWLFWAGCGLAVRTGQRAYLWLIALCGAAAGVLTPMMFYIDG